MNKYKIGEKVVIKTKVMTITKIYPFVSFGVQHYRYSCDVTVSIRNIGDNYYIECSNPWGQSFYERIVTQTIADKLIFKLDEINNVIEGTLDDIIDSLY